MRGREEEDNGRKRRRKRRGKRGGGAEAEADKAIRLRWNLLPGRLLDHRRDEVEPDVGCRERQRSEDRSPSGGGGMGDRYEGGGVTFGYFEFVVLLVPQAAPVTVGDPHGKLRVRAV